MTSYTQKNTRAHAHTYIFIAHTEHGHKQGTYITDILTMFYQKYTELQKSI